MPLDPARLADTRAWLEKARLDLGAGHADLRSEPSFTGDAMFHAQQATEKALKCLLAWHDTPFRKTHDLADLGNLCANLDGSLEPLLRRAALEGEGQATPPEHGLLITEVEVAVA